MVANLAGVGLQVSVNLEDLTTKAGVLSWVKQYFKILSRYRIRICSDYETAGELWSLSDENLISLPNRTCRGFLKRKAEKQLYSFSFRLHYTSVVLPPFSSSFWPEQLCFCYVGGDHWSAWEGKNENCFLSCEQTSYIYGALFFLPHLSLVLIKLSWTRKIGGGGDEFNWQKWPKFLLHVPLMDIQ